MKPRRNDQDGLRNSGGELWAGYSDLMAGLLLIFMFISVLARIATADSEGKIQKLLEEPSIELKQWRKAINELCDDKELTAEGIDVDCITGTILLPADVFFAFNAVELRYEPKSKLRTAIPIIVKKLESYPVIWQKLELIEVRGHADPKGKDEDPYFANLKISQQRSFNVLYFLATDQDLGNRLKPESWAALRNKSVASGASSSRAPPNCELLGDSCNEKWRRVELILGFDDQKFRAEMNDLVDTIMKELQNRR